MNDDVMYTLLADKVVYEEEFPHFVHDDSNLQNVFTPYELCENVINKITNYTSLKNKSILVFNLEFAIILLIKGYNKKDITFVTDSISKFVYAKEMVGIEAIETDLMKLETVMANRKFDVVIMNPPYQTKADEKFDKTKPIWQDFVKLSHDITKENGIIAAIHPSGWRDIDGQFVNTRKLIQSKKVHYLSINDIATAQSTFKVAIRFDWYVLENSTSSTKTEIDVTETGEKTYLDISQLSFIPNSNVEFINRLIAKDGEEKVEILYSRSEYGSDKKWVSETQNDAFKYPVIYSTGVGTKTVWYSSIKGGMFGIPKVVFNFNMPVGYYIDYTGEYGMSQFCVGIVGDKEYLEMVAGVISNQRDNGFRDFMESTHFKQAIFNRKVFETFRKDFWKEFV